jgi:hypothetical protein
MPRARFDLTGQQFGRWSVLARDEGPTPNGHSRWICRCSCGVERVVVGNNLRTGKSNSCGHEARTAGGLSEQFVSEYHTWRQMRERCGNPLNKGFKHYGARGIRTADRWNSFENFLEDMGPRPFPGAQLDRIDNDGGYNKLNCRWISALENSHNSTSVRLIEFGGISRPLVEWDRHLGFSEGTVARRLHFGWTVERALTQPKRRSPLRRR